MNNANITSQEGLYNNSNAHIGHTLGKKRGYIRARFSNGAEFAFLFYEECYPSRDKLNFRNKTLLTAAAPDVIIGNWALRFHPTTTNLTNRSTLEVLRDRGSAVQLWTDSAEECLRQGLDEYVQTGKFVWLQTIRGLFPFGGGEYENEVSAYSENMKNEVQGEACRKAEPSQLRRLRTEAITNYWKQRNVSIAYVDEVASQHPDFFVGNKQVGMQKGWHFNHMGQTKLTLDCVHPCGPSPLYDLIFSALIGALFPSIEPPRTAGITSPG